VQRAALRKWVYNLGDGKLGLTVHAVQDVVQRMNWTGKARIGLLVDNAGRPVLDVEQIDADGEPMWVATAYAKDELTGAVLPGAAMEPVRMHLRASTAAGKRKAGIKVREDDTVFDPFSRTKAIQKATRNALKAFVPQEVEQTVIAMFSGEADRVQKIQTVAEQQAAELPPPATGPEAEALLAAIRERYDAIKALGQGRGRLSITPVYFHSMLTQSQHSVERLRDMLAWLEGQHEHLEAAFAAEGGESS
jgi:hypothetical protein